jgi:SsrA-binding protein
MYFSDGYAKVEIALASGKREYDKRQTIAARESRREADRAMAARNRGQ